MTTGASAFSCCTAFRKLLKATVAMSKNALQLSKFGLKVGRVMDLMDGPTSLIDSIRIIHIIIIHFMSLLDLGLIFQVFENHFRS